MRSRPSRRCRSSGKPKSGSAGPGRTRRRSPCVIVRASVSSFWRLWRCRPVHPAVRPARRRGKPLDAAATRSRPVADQGGRCGAGGGRGVGTKRWPGTATSSKSGDQTAYVPFRLTHTARPMASSLRCSTCARSTRRDGMRASEEHSFLRDWLARGGDVPQRMGRNGVCRAGRDAGRRPGDRLVAAVDCGAARKRSAVLALQQRAFEKQAAARRPRRRRRRRSAIRSGSRSRTTISSTRNRRARPRASYERAMTLPPGEYDIFVGRSWIGRARRRRARRSCKRTARRARLLERSPRGQQPDPRARR